MSARPLLRALAAGVLLAATVSWGQEARGGISGRVTDPQGALVPGARIAVTNTATNETRRSVSNDTGYYEVNYLEPSVYTVSVEADEHYRQCRHKN
jgi:hypothetical protein